MPLHHSFSTLFLGFAGMFRACGGDGAQTKVIAPLHVYLRRSLAKFHQLLQIIRHEPLEEQVEQINQGLCGHYAYYGIAGNVGSLLGVYRRVERYWHEMLSSRSQQGKQGDRILSGSGDYREQVMLVQTTQESFLSQADVA
jgi:hypothetical protein